MAGSPQTNIKNILKKLGIGLYVAALTAAGFQLFAPEFLPRFQQADSLQTSSQKGVAQKLTIAYAQAPQTLEPTNFEASNRSYLLDIYQGLVRTDRHLKIEPVLAVSWGMLDPLTWEFHLRPEVIFHNGQKLTAEDVSASIERARHHELSQLQNLLNTIQGIHIIDEQTIRIQTRVPDPLLLNKLSHVYIFPRDLRDFSKPVGTGPFQFVSSQIKNQNTIITLKRFENYWGYKPTYSEVILQALPDREERIKALEEGTIDFLTNVPPYLACSIKQKYASDENCQKLQNKNITITSIPSLEVSFLIFNFAHPVLGQKDVRTALGMVLDRQTFVDMAFDFARPSNQFISNGILGYNPTLTQPVYDPEKAKAMVAATLDTVFEENGVIFDYPTGLEALAHYLKDQFSQIGIEVTLNPLTQEELKQKIAEGNSEMYFLGWRSELGDALDFLMAVGHSRNLENGYGQFNATHYRNKIIDGLIEKSQENLDIASRQEDLQKVMKILVEDDVIGIPLFESEIIYAFKKNLTFEPRVDGYVYPSEIK